MCRVHAIVLCFSVVRLHLVVICQCCIVSCDTFPHTSGIKFLAFIAVGAYLYHYCRSRINNTPKQPCLQTAACKKHLSAVVCRTQTYPNMLPRLMTIFLWVQYRGPVSYYPARHRPTDVVMQLGQLRTGMPSSDKNDTKACQAPTLL